MLVEGTGVPLVKFNSGKLHDISYVRVVLSSPELRVKEDKIDTDDTIEILSITETMHYGGWLGAGTIFPRDT